MNLFHKSPKKHYNRKAHHAGSWYLNNSHALNETLSNFMTAAENDVKVHNNNDDDDDDDDGNNGVPRGVISPHAGFSYSGSTAAYAYLALKEMLLLSGSTTNETTCTVLVMHPSHHVHLNGCAISGASTIETPIQPITIDDNLRSELMKTGSFSIMDQRTDEEEHSGEMQYPFISKCFADATKAKSSSSSPTPTPPLPSLLRVLPIMVGAISTRQEIEFGKILAPFIARPNIFVVISTDFCHWGERFRYSPTPANNTRGSTTIPPPSISSSSDNTDGSRREQIYQYIERLDRIGMDHISMQKPGAFAIYMKEYKNTICGRAPIAVYLNAIDTNAQEGIEQLDLRFVKYAQSSQVRSRRDSSVSYASAISRKL